MTQPVFHRYKAAACFLLGVTAFCALVLGLRAMLGTFAGPAADPRSVAADPQVRQVAAANTEFGFRVLKRLTRSTPDANVFFSPLSVTSALTMTLNGAGGATARDMASALGLNSMTLEQINHANGLLLPSLEDPDPKVKLAVANALWARHGTTFAPGFQQRCRRFYGARTQTLDFGSPAAADTINDWVKDKTQGKIDRLVTPPDISAADAVLTDAVYFHGQWQHEFEKAATRDGPFTLAGGGTRTLPMMAQAGRYPYLETARFQAISLPYGAGRISLYVFLPKAGADLNGFVVGLDAKSWQGWVGEMQPADVAVILPRFRVDYRTTLNQPLIALGMGSAFGPGADFKPMGLHGAFIGAVIHKAVLEVDEEGTVAAAATAVVMTKSARRPQGKVMRVDHPFFCALRDNATGTLLFAGVVRDPK